MIKLWEHNGEGFEFFIIKDYTMTFPELKIRKDGEPLMRVSLIDKSIIDIISEVHEQFPESKFLERLLTTATV